MRIQIIAVALAITVAGCGDRTDNGTSPPPDIADENSPAAMTLSDYVAAAAQGNMYEIESSRLAAQRATSGEVKQFAERMIRDHEGTSAGLRRFVELQGTAVQLPTGLDARRRGLIEALQAAPAGQFDSLYMSQQMAAHDEALALHRGYSEGGDNAEGRALAANAVRVIQMHHELLRAAAPQGTPSQDTGQMRPSPMADDASPPRATN